MAERGDRRWRLLLGEPADEALSVSLSAEEVEMDGALAALYDPEAEEGEGTHRSGGLGASAPRVAR